MGISRSTIYSYLYIKTLFHRLFLRLSLTHPPSLSLFYTLSLLICLSPLTAHPSLSVILIISLPLSLKSLPFTFFYLSSLSVHECPPPSHFTLHLLQFQPPPDRVIYIKKINPNSKLCSSNKSKTHSPISANKHEDLS